MVGNTGATWRTHMCGLPEYHCLTPDLPGFGRSQREPWRTRAATAERVASVIESRVPAGRAHVRPPCRRGARTALRLPRKATVLAGAKLLIYRASRGVGTYAVQLGSHVHPSEEV